jgi:subtilisin family serine protease
MHRVRTSLPFFEQYGWAAEVVTVDTLYTDMVQDELLLQSVPPGIKVHKVKAFDKRRSSKLGLGSIALRSLWYYRQYVNKLLSQQHFDLIYFSTTQFPVCVLGAYWKKKFNVPYVIDMQDPWHSEYYQDKPKSQQPPKYWFSYRLNKYMEPAAIKNADGLIAVSQQYITDLEIRYPSIKNVPAATITFGMFPPDLDIVVKPQAEFKQLLNPGDINIVYVGRGGTDMHKAITPVFEALAQGLKTDPAFFSRLKFYFIGTSYAPAGQGRPSILPLAESIGLTNQVIEVTDRISYYHSLAVLMQADASFIPGSDDAKYTASKIYPYLLTRKPLLAVFNPQSSAIAILKDFGINTVYNYDDITPHNINDFLLALDGKSNLPISLSAEAVKHHLAQTKTKLQCDLFNLAIRNERP